MGSRDCSRMTNFKVLKFPHLGLKLSLGETYSLADLQKKCAGKKDKLSALNKKIKDKTIFAPVTKAVKKTAPAMKGKPMKSSEPTSAKSGRHLQGVARWW